MQLITKYLLPTITLAAGVLLSFLGTFTLNSMDNARVVGDFERNSISHIATIEKSLIKNLNALSKIKEVFDGNDFVTRQEFKTLTSPYLLTHQHVQALEWIPVIRHSQREAYEAMAKKDGLTDFEIRQRSTTGKMIVAPKRERYYPVFYVEPLAGNKAAVGFDLGSNPARLAALDKSIDSAQAVATSPIILVQETEKQSGILVFLPIFNQDKLQKKVSVWSMKERRENIEGFVLLVLRVGSLISSSIEHFHTDNIIVIDEITDPENIVSLYNLNKNIEYKHNLVVQKVIDVAGRTWRISVYPESKSYLLNNNPLMWLIFILGTLATGMLSYYLVHMINREKFINQQVKQKTAELAYSEYKANIVLNTAGEAIFTVNSIGKISTFNAAASLLFGYIETEAIGITLVTLFKDQKYFSFNNLNETTHNLDRFIEVECQKSDGTIFMGEFTYAKYTVADNVMYSFFLRDISDRKKLEDEQGLLIDKLNESNSDLQRFAYVASHDLQEPLRMVCNFTELLEKEYGSSLDKDALSYMKISGDAARRMQVLVNDLLEFSKISVGQDYYEIVNCTKIVESIKADLTDVIEKTNALVNISKMPEIYANSSSFLSLMQNLISNSLKYMKPETIPRIDVSFTETEQTWVFCVADNGIGVEEKYYKQIFQAFKRLHNKSEFAGSGIGLAICARIVERMNGKIWIESEIDVGSKFFFEIPKNEDNSKLKKVA